MASRMCLVPSTSGIPMALRSTASASDGSPMITRTRSPHSGFVRAAGVGGHGVPVGKQLIDGEDPMVTVAPKTVTFMRVGVPARG
jgi:hypothetical protein